MNDIQDPVDRFIVVGGSLAGLTCALALAAKGLQSVVVERTPDFGLAGGALGVDRQLLAQVTGLDPARNSTTPALAVTKSSREATAWKLLHQWLRHHALESPFIAVREGTAVVNVRGLPGPTVEFADGSALTGAAVLGADGYRSTVRGFVDPSRPLATYTGYMLWRGLVSERLMPRSTAWPVNRGFGTLTEQGYRLIAYPVPGADGSTQPGERQISFAWYEVGRDELLREQGCLSPAGEVLSTLPFSRIPQTVRSFLLEQASQVWPHPWNLAVEIAISSGTLFATPICEYMPERLSNGSVAILGDAAHVATPMTGSGFANGVLDAVSLAEVLSRRRGSATSALKQYELQRLSAIQRFVATSQKLSARYVRYSVNSRAGPQHE